MLLVSWERSCINGGMEGNSYNFESCNIKIQIKKIKIVRVLYYRNLCYFLCILIFFEIQVKTHRPNSFSCVNVLVFCFFHFHVDGYLVLFFSIQFFTFTNGAAMYFVQFSS